ncbi:hypothetical protein CDAR_264491 [Caerostris darwini]|uniref:Uncharacterized protein n=1 Tax=Caerostris darwini TaxID=1538125 RepID=A0AAV4TJW8_9ARAC|nr:hypothetical protein CDAR_264491 [Caerostris darwini]
MALPSIGHPPEAYESSAAVKPLSPDSECEEIAEYWWCSLPAGNEFVSEIGESVSKYEKKMNNIKRGLHPALGSISISYIYRAY